MAERKCLMTFYPTDCKDNCFNCECGGAEATKDMYVSIHNVQRVCAITGGAADTDEGVYIAEVIRNNLENMVMPAADVQPVKRGRWIETHISLCKWIPEDEKEEGHSFYMAEMKCSCCERYNTQTFSLTLNKPDFCQHCGARMNGGEEDENSI